MTAEEADDWISEHGTGVTQAMVHAHEVADQEEAAEVDRLASERLELIKNLPGRRVGVVTYLLSSVLHHMVEHPDPWLARINTRAAQMAYAEEQAS